MPNQLSDSELIDKYQSTTDQRYLAELYTQYTHLVFGVCMKYFKNQEASQDALMNIYEELIEKVHRHDILEFKPWLYMVVRNHCLMVLRKNKSTDQKFVDFSIEQTSNVQNDSFLHLTNEAESQEQLEAILADCLGGLKKEQQECVHLFYIEEKAYKEVADITKHDLKKVKSYIQNGKRNLKKCLEDKIVKE